MTAPPRRRPPRRNMVKDVVMEILDPDAIYAARQFLDETLVEVADHCKIAHQTLSKIERGVQKTVSPRVAGKLTRYLNLPREGVFGPPLSVSRNSPVLGTRSKDGVSDDTV